MAITSFREENFFLSNMYPSSLIVEGQKYPSAEHAFQAMKSTNKTDRAAIALCKTPKEAKRMGRHIALRKDWEKVKNGVMLDILREKFKNAELAEKLKNTGNEELMNLHP